MSIEELTSTDPKQVSPSVAIGARILVGDEGDRLVSLDKLRVVETVDGGNGLVPAGNTVMVQASPEVFAKALEEQAQRLRELGESH